MLTDATERAAQNTQVEQGGFRPLPRLQPTLSVRFFPFEWYGSGIVPLRWLSSGSPGRRPADTRAFAPEGRGCVVVGGLQSVIVRNLAQRLHSMPCRDRVTEAHPMGHKTAGFPGVAPGTRRGALAAPSLGPKGGLLPCQGRFRSGSVRAGCDSGRDREGRDTIPRRGGTLRVRRPRQSGRGIPPARSPARPTRSYVSHTSGSNA